MRRRFAGYDPYGSGRRFPCAGGRGSKISGAEKGSTMFCNNNGNNVLWLILILILFCGCGGSNGCGCNDGCGC